MNSQSPMTLDEQLWAAEAENKRLRTALAAVVQWAEDLRLYSEAGTQLAPVFVQAKEALSDACNPSFADDFELSVPK